MFSSTLRSEHEVYKTSYLAPGRRQGCICPRSGWMASSLKKKCLDAVHDRPPTL